MPQPATNTPGYLYVDGCMETTTTFLVFRAVAVDDSQRASIAFLLPENSERVLWLESDDASRKPMPGP
jgi:hypothetical protein